MSESIKAVKEPAKRASDRKSWLKYIALIPGIAALVSIVLYVLGFLVVFSYMAGFGFSSYSIVNIKFIVAGLWAFVGLAFAFYSFYYGLSFLHPILDDRNVFKRFFQMTSYARSICYFLFILTPFLTGSLFFLVVNSLGEQPFGKSPNLVASVGFGNYDIIGQFINTYFQFLPTNPSYSYILSHVVYVFVYCSILILPYTIYRRFRPKSAKPIFKKSSAKKKLIKNEKSEQIYLRRWWDVYIDIFGIAFVAVSLLYAYKKLLVERVTITNFSSSSIHPGTLQVWLMNLVVFLLAFKLLGWANNWKNNIKKQDEFDNLVRSFLVPLIAAIISFGQVIYPRISYSIGGGRPRQVIIHERTDRLVDPTKDKVYLIDETSDYYFLVVQTPLQNKAIQLKKDNVGWIEVVNQQTATTSK
ncbi:MAG: hypothetical protein PHW63_05655 [Alphaproteobacteria bacterium]|nr:hypothetical protein [Alphaproteobacteria bacterium]